MVYIVSVTGFPELGPDDAFWVFSSRTAAEGWVRTLQEAGKEARQRFRRIKERRAHCKLLCGYEDAFRIEWYKITEAPIDSGAHSKEGDWMGPTVSRS